MADFKVSEFLKMQRTLADEKGWSESRVPQEGHMSLLWSIDELGEAIAIIKKKGWEEIMNNPSVRAHYVEECADVFMYLYDMFECYGITGEEFSDAYKAKFEKNMGRKWAENSSMYENIGYKLAIFDMDGVLVDSEPAIKACAIDALREFGVNATESDFDEYIGKGDDLFIGGTARKHGAEYDIKMKARTYEIYLETAKERVHAMPWTERMLEVISRTDTKIAVASSSDEVKVRKNLEITGADLSIFSAIITGSDVTKKKPDPEIFLKASEKCGIEPKDCVVFEDAVSGVMAAKAAGMTCVAVTTSFPRQALIDAGADRVVDNLMDFFKA